MAYSSSRGAAWKIDTTIELPDALSTIQFEDTHTFEELSGEQCLA